MQTCLEQLVDTFEHRDHEMAILLTSRVSRPGFQIWFAQLAANQGWTVDSCLRYTRR